MKFTDKHFYATKMFVVYNITINNIVQLFLVENGFLWSFFWPLPGHNRYTRIPYIIIPCTVYVYRTRKYMLWSFQPLNVYH